MISLALMNALSFARANWRTVLWIAIGALLRLLQNVTLGISVLTSEIPSLCNSVLVTIKCPQCFGGASDIGARSPFLSRLAKIYPRFDFSISGRFYHVFHIQFMRNLSQIINSIVALVSVYVIYAFWNPPIDNGKNYPMGTQPHIQNRPLLVALAKRRKCFLVGILSIPCRVRSFLHTTLLEKFYPPRPPKQLSRLRLIAEQLAAQFRRDIGAGSHSADSLHCGQGRTLLTQCFRPIFPIRITICSQMACDP